MDRGRLPDLRGRAAVVTGGNTGLGFRTARLLAARGAGLPDAGQYPHLDLLINNAGGVNPRPGRSADGFETTADRDRELTAVAQ